MSALNTSQQAAIRYLDGPLLVLAGAGSGKTRVITEKIAYLVNACGFAPRNIAAITFTNKAAKEMRERFGKLAGAAAAGEAQISTFHALGVRILREEARALGYKPRFSIFDAADCAGILGEAAGTIDRAGLRRLQGIISGWKNALISPEAARVHAATPDEARAARAYLAYEATLKAYQAVDFDDLIRLPAALFETHPELAEKWQNRLRYLLIDEYQDTNAAQYRLFKQLTGPRAQFTAVGDDDQGIYAWRGADIANLQRLPEEFPALKVILLEQNYRSTGRILKAANNLITHNAKLFDKKLWSSLGHGDAITVTACKDNEAEAESVIMKLEAHRFEHRTAFRDYAILYRSNHLARLFEQQLRNHKIPYLLSGGQSFFDRAEIKDITAYLRLIANEDDDPAFIRAATTPKRGIGAATLQALGQYAGERQSCLFAAAREEGFAQRTAPRQIEPLLQFCDFIERIRRRAGAEPAHRVLPDLLAAIDYQAHLLNHEEERLARARWANVEEFADWLNKKGEEEGKTLIEITQGIALTHLLDKEDADIDAVRLSTLHAAKGLEYAHVFLVGVEEGLLPHHESIENAQVEEERRLMYVGITRARRSLHLSYCRRRKQARDFLPRDPSRFIAEMGKEDLRFYGGKEDATPDKATGTARLAAMKAMLGGKDKK